MSDSVGKVSLDLELENDLLGGLQNAVAEMKGQLQKAISGIMKSCKLELDTSAADKQVESLGGKLKDSMKAASKVAGDALRRETQQAAQEAERSIGKITEGARNASKNRAPPDESSILRQMERVAALMDAQAYRAETLSNQAKELEYSLENAFHTDADALELRDKLSRVQLAAAKAAAQADALVEKHAKLEDQLAAVGKIQEEVFSSDALDLPDEEIDQFVSEITNGFKNLESMDLNRMPIVEMQHRVSEPLDLSIWERFKETLSSIGRAAGTVAKNMAKVAFQKLTAPLRGLVGIANKASNALHFLGQRFKTLITRRAFSAMIRAAIQSLQDLCKYDEATNTSLSMLKSSITQLKNSFGAAFAPILNYVAPILTTLIEHLAAAANAVAKFFAALTGQKTVVVAKKVTQDYAKSLTDTGAAAKEAQKTIAGFDQITKLNGSSGGSGGSSGLSPEEMFETIEVGSFDVAEKAKSLFQEIWSVFKAAWENEGQPTLDALKEAFGKIKILAGEIGSSFMTVFTNGTGQTTLETYLRIVQNLANCAGNFAQQLAIAWSNGDNGTRTVQSWWDIFNGILGLVERISGATAIWLGSLDLSPAMESVANFSTALSELLAPALDAIGQMYEKIMLPLAGWVVEEAAPASIDAITSALQALEAFFTPFYEGFMKLWDKVYPIVKWIGDFAVGIINSIKDQLDKLTAKLREKKDKIANIIEGIGKIISAWWGIMKPRFERAKEWICNVIDFIGSIVSITIGGIIDVLDGLIDFIVGVFTGDWAKAWDGVTKVVSGVVNFVVDIVNAMLGSLESFVNGFIRIINSIIRSINSISVDVPDWVPLIGGQHIGFHLKEVAEVSIAKIPHMEPKAQMINAPELATGGLIEQPTLAMVGESGDEAVMPLEHNTGWINKLAGELAGQMNGSGNERLLYIVEAILEAVQAGSHTEIYMDRSKVTSEIIKDIKMTRKRTGRDPLFSM